MNRISMVGSPAFAEDRIPVSGPVAAVPESGTAVGGLGELTPGFGFAFLLVWAATGIAAAVVLRQRGHHFASTAAVGLVFGPFFIPLAVRYARARHDDASTGPVVVAAGTMGSGPVHVLVGLVGDSPDVSGVRPLLHSLGERLGRLTMVRVLNFEVMLDHEERTRAALALSCSSLFLYDHDPELVLLGGHPRRALCDHASRAGYHLVVVVGRSQRAFITRRESASDASTVPMLFVPTAPAVHE
ncbi:MAG: hypothetical protein ACR2HM_01955 [Acidimicrobiales bacterium]